jgi:hypothetical protein
MGATIPAGSADAPGLRLKLIFTGVIAFLAAAAVYASVLIAQRQAVLDLEARYNITACTARVARPMSATNPSS